MKRTSKDGMLNTTIRVGGALENANKTQQNLGKVVFSWELSRPLLPLTFLDFVSDYATICQRMSTGMSMKKASSFTRCRAVRL
jgi:hypothetical protein